MPIMIYPEKMDPAAVSAHAAEIANVKNPMLASLCLITGSTLGGSKEYLTSIINAKDVDKLEYGESLCVFSPTGSGKTKAMELIIAALSSDSHLIVLANRRICKTQVLKDLIKCPNIPGALIEKIKVNDNVEVMTYQEFARKKHKYQGKKLVLICDECHCFAEDATFSLYPQHVVNFLNGNLDNTKRIYITATPSDVLPILWDIENLSDKPLCQFDPDNIQHFLRVTPDADCTRIKHTYIMQSDWTYLKFAVYHPAKRKELAEYIQKFCAQGKKALIYINDMEAGAEMQELLGDSQRIYSSDDKKDEIQKIALQEGFDASALVTTKVAENGWSIHDDNLSLIVAETCDMVELQQIIGRARVGRKKPREIQVLIPDYDLSLLGNMEGKLYMQLSAFQKAADNPDFALQYLNQPNPYVCYDAILKKPLVNRIGLQQLRTQLNHIRALKTEEQKNSHAFVRKVLETYGKPTEGMEELFLDDDITKACQQRIVSAWGKYKSSNCDPDALKALKEELKAACNETGAYPKELKSNIQIDTVNDILLFAGIHEIVSPEIRRFEITDRSSSALSADV